MCTKNGSYCEKEKVGGRGGGRVDVNGEVKHFFLGGGGGGGRVGGSGWM